MRTVHVKVTVDLTVKVDDDQCLDDVMNEMDYNFTASPDTNADIEDMEIVDWEVLDSR